MGCLNCYIRYGLLRVIKAAYWRSMILSSDRRRRFNSSSIWNLPSLCGTRLRCHLPVSRGGLGVQLTTDLALPAFLSSVAGASTLTVRLLPNRLKDTSGLQDIFYTTSCIEWQTRCNSEFPDTDKIWSQKAWDLPLVSKKLDGVLSAAHTQAHARLIAATALHSGDFLNAVPCSAVGTRLDDTSLRLAIALRLGAIMCAPHSHMCLWRSGRRWWNIRPRLQEVSRPSNASQRRQRPDQEGAGLRQCTVIAGTKFVVPWRLQAPRWLDRVAVGQRTLPRVGFYVPRYVSCQSP